MRRAIAAVGLLIVVILIALGVHSCQVSARNSSLKDYNNNVSSIMQLSATTVGDLFSQLSKPVGAAGASALQNEIDQDRVAADQKQLSPAESMSVPSEMSAAQQTLVLVLRMRRDAIADIASQIEQALGNSTNKDAISAIAGAMALLYASDVVYKTYTVNQIAEALNGADLKPGSLNGPVIYGGQVFPDLSWLQPPYITAKIGATPPSSSGGKIAPGTHGHQLNSVSVAGTQLQTGSTNTIPASPAPTFSLNLTNSGQNVENNVVCQVSVGSDTGTTTIPQTTAGQTTTCSVTLPSPPPTGTSTVTATVKPVPGEKNVANNTLSFPVTFQ